MFKQFFSSPGFRKQWLPFLVAFVLPLVAAYWWWGGFNSVTIREAETGPYHFAYMLHEGDLGKLPKTQNKVFNLLEQAGIPAGDTMTLLLTDPRTTLKPDQRAKTGYAVPADARLPEGLALETIPQRRVVSASVHAGVMLAPGKAYDALNDYLLKHGKSLRVPTLEIYRPTSTPAKVGEFTVEVPTE